MQHIFETTDKTGREIHLSKERWTHIRKKHPEIEDHEELEMAIRNPDKITHYSSDDSIDFYYKYFKDKPSPDKYLLVLVKYLNGQGYVITAYLEDKIK